MVTWEIAEDPDEHTRTLRLHGYPKPMSARELREVEELSGMKFAELQDDTVAAQQMVVYLALKRRGAEVSWEEASDIGLEIVDRADPFEITTSSGSLRSVDTGESPPASMTS